MNDTKEIPDKKKEASPTDFILPLRKLFKKDLEAIILYGSWLRGQRNTLLDFYVLKKNLESTETTIKNLACKILPPNVYALKLNRDPEMLGMAKYSTMTLRSLEKHIDKDFHPYFWARFCQPAVVIWARDLSIRDSVHKIFARARSRMIEENLPLLTEGLDDSDFWENALIHTYNCELRSERPEKIASIVESNKPYLRKALSEFSTQKSPLFASISDVTSSTDHSTYSTFGARRWTQRNWGKFLSLARLVKAAFTFNDALEYVLWKIERHSGIHESPSPLQCRYPLLLAWPLLWRIYRKGGFK